MAKDLLQGNKNFWEDTPEEGIDLFANAVGEPKKADFIDRHLAGIKQAAASGMNTLDTGVSLAASTLANLFGDKAGQEEIFKNLNQRTKARDWGKGIDPGFTGKLAGGIATLPLGIINQAFSPAEAGKTFLDQGESLGRAGSAAGIDAAGNVLGFFLPPGVGKAAKVAIGAGSNASLDAATKKLQSEIATQQTTKDMFAPTWESAALSGVIGGGIGALQKSPKKKASKPIKDMDALVAAEKPVESVIQKTPGMETAGPVDLLYQQMRRAQEEAIIKHETDSAALADQGHQQSLIEKKAQLDAILARIEQEHQQSLKQIDAEQFAASKEPVQDMTGLSTGEGMSAVKDPARAPIVDSGLMGLPEGPKTGPVGLSTGEQGVASPATNKSPMGPSNLFGEPLREQVIPGIPDALRAGEGGVASPATNAKTPTDPYGQMGAAGGLEDTRPRIDPALAAGETGVARAAPNVKPASPNTPLDPFAGAAGAGNKRIGKFGQGGSAPMINDLANGVVALGKGIKAKFTGIKPEVQDTVTNPVSPENIAKKQELSRKAKAVGVTDSVYHTPTTIEEVVANPGKDIGYFQELASGTEGVIRRNPTNAAVKFVRGLRSAASNATDMFTQKYITGKSGMNKALAALSPEEKMEIHQLTQALSKNEIDYTSGIADKAGLTENQRAYMEARERAFKAQLELANKVNQSLGFEIIEARKGYSPGVFSRTHTALIGHYEQLKNGGKRWVTEAVANGDSAWEYKKALQYYKDKGMEIIELDRKGMKSDTQVNRTFDGTMNLLAALAEHDERFAEAKADLDTFLKGQTKQLYGFNVHELRKKGVEGNIGNKPWLDAERNSKEALKAEVDYLDGAFKYWNYQDVLNKTKQLIDHPGMEAQPNTRRYLADYVKQLTGTNINPLGAGGNWSVDKLAQGISKAAGSIGLEVKENPAVYLRGLREAGSALMMNIYAPLFATIQLAQIVQSGFPEALKIAKDMGVPQSEAVSGFGKAFMYRSMLPLIEGYGFDISKTNVPQHIQEAYKWGKEHALDHYNEAQMSHEGTQNPKWTATKNIAFWPTRLPEMFTRPMAFLWYSDLFHQAGLRGEELHQTAKNAADYAMANYHPDERPMIYQQLGAAGQGLGALRTYYHNQVEQIISRTKEAQKNPAAFLTMLGFMGALSGVAGLPFYNEIDQMLVQPLTGKSSRDWLKNVLHPSVLDGAASVYSGLDFQSRFSLADGMPDSFAGALAGPQLTKMFQLAQAGYGFAKQGDTASFNELMKQALPSGAYGMYEEANLVTPDGMVLDKEGQIKYDEPRTEKERRMRKMFGIRPLRERVEDEELYADKKEYAKMTKEQQDQVKKMKSAINFMDTEGFQQAYDKYKEKGGDPTVIQSLFEKNAVNANLSARQRASGIPSNNIKSIQKNQHYWED